MTPKEIAKSIYTEVFNEGKATDYFYSPDFEKMAKEKAINRADRKYEEPLRSEIVEEIKKM